MDGLDRDARPHRHGATSPCPPPRGWSWSCSSPGWGCPLKPRFCNPNGSLEAWTFLKARTEPGPQPTGYHPDPGHAIIGQYPWKDYREVLDHLRKTTTRTTRIANALESLPAVTGPVGRLSAFPAESIAWLRVVREEDEGRFADALRAAEDSRGRLVPARGRDAPPAADAR